MRAPLALEMVTRGLARATSHRVLAPAPGSGPRYSVPFFQNIAQELRLAESVLDFPPEVLKLKEQRGDLGATRGGATKVTLGAASRGRRCTDVRRRCSTRAACVGASHVGGAGRYAVVCAQGCE